MLLYQKLLEATKLADSLKTEESLECQGCDWLWGNGKSYCPYCQKPIKEL